MQGETPRERVERMRRTDLEIARMIWENKWRYPGLMSDWAELLLQREQKAVASATKK